MKVAKARKSSVLASNAIHHRVDSLTGIVSLVAIVGANLFREAAWLDPVGGLLISLMVIKAGFSNTMSALFELADRAIDDDVKKSVTKTANKVIADLPGGSAIEVREIAGIKSGQNYLLDVELAVPSDWTVERLSEVEESVRTAIGAKVRGARRIRFRFVMADKTDATLFDEFISGDVSPRSSPEPEDDHDHDHDHEHSHGNGNGVKKTN